MSILDNTIQPDGRVKTVGIRFEADIHADLTLIASLRGTSLQAEVVEACRAHVATVKSSPELASKADEVLADIERDAAARRESFARLFGTTAETSGETEPPTAPAPAATAAKPTSTTTRKSSSTKE